MNTQSLQKQLIDKGYNPDYICIEGNPVDNQLCLTKMAQGWEVYYFERGSKFDIREFQNEESACSYFLEKVKKNDSLKEFPKRWKR